VAQLMPLIKGVLVPLLVALIVYYSCARFFKRTVAAVAVTVGFLAGHYALVGWPGLPPGDASHWLFFLVPLLLIITLAVVRLPKLARLGIILAFFAVSLILLLRAMIDYHWTTTGSAVLRIGALTIAGSLVDIGFRYLSCPGSGGRWIRWHLVWILSLEAVMLGLSGSVLLAQLTGAMAAALGPLALFPRDRVHVDSALCAVIALAITALACLGHFYSKLPLYAAALLVLAALAPLALPKSVRTRGGFAGLWPSIVVTAVPGLVALALLIRQTLQDAAAGPW